MASTPLIRALGTDTESINVTVITSETLAWMPLYTFNESLALADVIYVDRFMPWGIDLLQLLVSHVNGTISYDGLIMFGIMQNGSVPGEGDLTPSQVDAIAPVLPVSLSTSYVNSTGNSSAPGYAIEVKPASGVPENSTILANCIPWDTCPLVDRRLVVSAMPGAAVVLTDQTGSEPVLAEWNISDNDSSVMVFSMEIIENNRLFTSFPCFAYLMYVCTFHAMYNYSDSLIDSWEEWPFSPGYGGDLPWAWLILTLALVGVALWLYYLSRKVAAKSRGGGGKAALGSDTRRGWRNKTRIIRKETSRDGKEDTPGDGVGATDGAM
ncbi:MAG: hypothetical protein JW839_16845 [Candidatus Lokiarchaeota archaeon]|nr:hypothetical protein [Candidatus Lokiarchaeota archaeon]